MSMIISISGIFLKSCFQSVFVKIKLLYACIYTSIFFQIPVTYPTTAPEIALPELDGKTAKMYR